MYKKASANSQARLSRSAEVSRDNTAGLDPEVFKETATDELSELIKKREALVTAKRENEIKLSKLSLEIKMVKGAYSTGRAGISYDSYLRMETERNNLIRSNRALDVRFQELKAAIVRVSSTAQSKKHSDFASVFMAVAKELLATPVYDRIVAATIYKFEE